MMHIAIIFCWITTVYSAYPEHGLSVSLEADQVFRGDEWSVIKDWKYDGKIPGHFLQGVELGNSTESSTGSKVGIKKAGIYYVTVHASLHHHSDNTTRIGVVVNGDVEQKMPLYVTRSSISDFAMSGFLHLEVYDSLSVHIKGKMSFNTSFIMSQYTYFGVQYHREHSATVGFSLALPTHAHITNDAKQNPSRSWKAVKVGQFSSWRVFEYGETNFQVPYDGVYMLATNLMFQAFEEGIGISVKLFSAGKEFVNAFERVAKNSTITTSINEIVALKADDVIKMIVTTDNSTSSVTLLKGSTYSVVLLKPSGTVGDGFHTTLSLPHSFVTSTVKSYIPAWIQGRQKEGDFKNFSASIDMVDDRFFNNRLSQVFYVSSQIVFNVTVEYEKVSYKDLQITIAFQKDYSVSKRNAIYVKRTLTAQYVKNVTNMSKPEKVTLTFRCHLAGVFELSRVEPLGISIIANKNARVSLHRDSTFSVLQTIPYYPGGHVSLQGKPRFMNQNKPYVVNDWMKKNYRGLYDFIDNFEEKTGSFLAKVSGTYFATTNIIVEDVEVNIRLEAFIETDDKRRVIRYKDGAPSQTTTINLGGLFELKRGDRLFFRVTAAGDESWKIITGGFSVAYISLQPIYFIATTAQDQIVELSKSTQKASDMISKIVFPAGALIDSLFIVKEAGVYFTSVNVILDRFESRVAFPTTYKIFLRMNGKDVAELYGKRKTLHYSIGSYMTLFFSGSFYAVKGMEVSLHIECDVKHTYQVSEYSTWNMVFIGHGNQLSASQRTLYRVAVFPSSSDSSPTVGNWGNNLGSGYALTQYNSLYFQDKEVRVTKDGMFMISLNLEIGYSNRGTATVIKLAILVNKNRVQNIQNGMTSWEMSSYLLQTIHICATIFLRAGDVITIQIQSTNLDQITIKKPSSFSVVMVPEYIDSSLFVAKLRNDIEFGIGRRIVDLTGWEFNSGLSSPRFDVSNGVMMIPSKGYYSMRLFIPVFTFHPRPNKVKVVMKINGLSIKEYHVNLISKINNLDVHEIVYCDAYDDIKFQLFDNDPVSMTTLQVNNNTNTSQSDKMLLKADGSTFTMVYLNNLIVQTGWTHSYIDDTFIDYIGDTVLTPGGKIVPGGPNDHFKVKDDGLYFLNANNIIAKNIIGSVQLSFRSEKGSICSSTHSCTANCEYYFIMSCIANLTTGEKIKLYLKNDQPGVVITRGSQRQINEIPLASSKGFSMQLTKSYSIYLNWDRWTSISGWSHNQEFTPGTFTSGVLSSLNDFVLKYPGTYQIAANLQLNVGNCSINCGITATAAILINDVNDAGNHQTIDYPTSVNSFTVHMVRLVNIKKWDKLSIMLRSRTEKTLHVMAGSTWSAVLLKTTPLSTLDNHGPVIVSKLTPGHITTNKTGMKWSWTCRAVGDGDITYTWYKENDVIFTEKAPMSVLRIQGEVQDMGTYQCHASIKNSVVVSNKVTFNITDVDECDLGMHTCSAHAKCSNVFASYICTCNKGFHGNGTHCNDTDECIVGEFQCDVNAVCVNTFGGYNCTCVNGYQGDGSTCKDANECEINPNICGYNATCNNTIGSYNCSCSEGFKGDYTNKTCRDVDECTEVNLICGLNAYCNNAIGSYDCTCMSGYTGQNCTDIDECELVQCFNNSQCVNLNGSYSCQCIQGYKEIHDDKKGSLCTDINECVEYNSTCGANQNCTNTHGSYDCTCTKGYAGNGHNCTDIDECSLNATKCWDNSICVNTPGGHTCQCKPGFEENMDTHGNTTCTDIDECMDGVQCAANADCKNTAGSYVCTCRYGWQGDGRNYCMDINECEENRDICGHGNCTNIGGSHICICHQGYRQNRLTCTLDVGGQVAAQEQTDNACADPKSFKCLCIVNVNPKKRENNILCNGLFAALLILVLVATVVVVFVIKYIKSRKLRRIKPVKTHRDKYVEIENVSEV